MMYKITLPTLFLSSIIITACSGSGGGGNNNQPSAIPETKLTNSDLTISKNAFKKGELNSSPVMSGNKKVGELSGYNRNYSFNGAFKKEDNIDEIIVDGVTKFAISKVTNVIGGLTGKALSSALEISWNASKNPTRDIFYFGHETPAKNIPQKGIVTYKGNASRYHNVWGDVRNIGEATLVANFDDKTIKGELDITYLARNIALHETQIVGNSFNGKAVAEGNIPFFISQEGQYEGKFFGPNAEEVAGKATFDESVKDLNTSFSAERTK